MEEGGGRGKNSMAQEREKKHLRLGFHDAARCSGFSESVGDMMLYSAYTAPISEEYSSGMFLNIFR